MRRRPTTSDAPAAPIGHHSRHHGRHRRHTDTPEAQTAAAPANFALQVFAADRGAAPAPQSRMGPASALVAEVGAMIRALQPAAAGAAQAVPTVTVANAAPSVSGGSGEQPPTVASGEGSQRRTGAPPSRMWIDLGLYKGSSDLSESLGAITYGLSPEVGFALRVAQVYTLQLSITGAFGDGTGNNGPGNPVVGLSRWFDVGDHQESSAFFAQLGVSPFYRFGVRSGVGLDLRGVWRPALGGLFQVSMVPRIRLSPGSVDIDTWCNLNLDEPLGFSFDSGKVWGLGVTVGFPI